MSQIGEVYNFWQAGKLIQSVETLDEAVAILRDMVGVCKVTHTRVAECAGGTVYEAIETTDVTTTVADIWIGTLTSLPSEISVPIAAYSTPGLFLKKCELILTAELTDKPTPFIDAFKEAIAGHPGGCQCSACLFSPAPLEPPEPKHYGDKPLAVAGVSAKFDPKDVG
ncbi:MAG: hypothetical protein JKY94_17685 [Rhodobacteraceae bacterium]|nr:hypothetical protein [Paracoccaceae bacterium]